MNLIDSFGSIATILFILATVFQALKSTRDGHAKDLSHGMLWSWALGEISMLIYVLAKFGFDWILFINYAGQLFFVLVIMRYKYFPRKGV